MISNLDRQYADWFVKQRRHGEYAANEPNDCVSGLRDKLHGQSGQLATSRGQQDREIGADALMSKPIMQTLLKPDHNLY
jgi:hypothetical protein